MRASCVLPSVPGRNKATAPTPARISVAPNGTWCRTSKAAVFDSRIPAEALRVLMALGAYADDLGRCTPSVGTLAEMLNLSRRQVQRHLRVVERLGYLQSWRQIRVDGRGGHSSNGYVLSFPPAPSLRRARNAGDAPSRSAPTGHLPDRSGEDDTGNGNGATPDDAPIQSGATCDAAPAASSVTSSVTRLSQAVRHPEVSGATSEGRTGASSGDAQTSPLNYPKENEPKAAGAQARERKGGPTSAGDRPNEHYRRHGSIELTRWYNQEPPEIRDCLNRYFGTMTEDERVTLLIEIGTGKFTRRILMEEVRALVPSRALTVAA